MLLKQIFFMLLLVPTALTTPVPGKEIATRELEGTIRDTNTRRDLAEEYTPDLDQLCYLTPHRPSFVKALGHGRSCDPNSINKFKFTCVTHRYMARAEVTSQCDVNYYCIEYQLGGRNIVAGPDYLGPRQIRCKLVTTTLGVGIKPGVSYGETSRSKKPPGHSGEMTGILTLSGDISGSAPALDWRYLALDRPGKNLLGEYVVKRSDSDKTFQKYPIQFNYDHHARFFASVNFLSPKHKGTLQLTAYLTLVAASITPRDEELSLGQIAEQGEEEEQEETEER